MRKKEKIVNHGLLKDSINYKALIETEANTPARGGNAPEPKSKVKTLVKQRNTSYYRRNNDK